MQINGYIPSNVIKCLYFLIWPIFEAWAEILTIVSMLFWKMEDITIFFWDYLTFSIPQMSNEHLKKGQFVFPTLYCELGIFIIFTLFYISLIWLFNSVNWLSIDNLFFSSPNNSVLHQLKPEEPVQSRNYLKKVVMKRWKIWQTYSINTRIHLGLFFIFF